MSYAKIADMFKAVSLIQPNVRQSGEGDIVKNLNGNKRNKWNYTNIHLDYAEESDGMMRYNCVLVYASRLDDDLESNRLQLQNLAILSLQNIIRGMAEELDLEVGTIQYRTFTQRFGDETAGAYATVIFEEAVDECYEEYGQILYSNESDNDNG